TDVAELAHRQLMLARNMRIPYTLVQTKQVTISENQNKAEFENLYSGTLPDLVVIGLVADADISGNYHRNPFNFRNFGVTEMSLMRNGISVPRRGYKPNFANGQYIRDYITFQEQLGYDISDKCVPITPEEWANGYTFWVFKITDGPIGSGVAAPRSKAVT